MIRDPWARLIETQNTYDGVEHEYTGNYIRRFIFDNAVNIMLAMIMLNMI